MKKQILVGAESFEKTIEGGYFYIDKTLFVKELLENKGEVTLVTRPRRFGKTMNMSMLSAFFDISKDSKALFEGLLIGEHQNIIEKHMNKYPVISMTLKNVNLPTYAESIARIKFLISGIYRQNRYLCESDNFDEYTKKKFNRYCSEESTTEELQIALLFLTECLYSHYNKRAIVLIDEYDSPIDTSVGDGYYGEMIRFMRGFLGSVFKTNDYLEFGVLTGVQRISKESLFSSFNNPKICGVMDKEFSTSFGFTEEEVKDACESYGAGGKFPEVKNWYDGYRFGGVDMYNPWSISRYLETQELDNYWVNTGSVGILRDVFYKGDDNLKNDLAGLLTGEPVMMSLEDGTAYPIKYVKSDTFWTLLLNAGYIKPCNGAKAERFAAELVNMEVKSIFSRYAKNWFGEQSNPIPEVILEFVSHLLDGDAKGVSDTLNGELLNNPSCHGIAFHKKNCEVAMEEA